VIAKGFAMGFISIAKPFVVKTQAEEKFSEVERGEGLTTPAEW
jgi:hypothetical protein